MRSLNTAPRAVSKQLKPETLEQECDDGLRVLRGRRKTVNIWELVPDRLGSVDLHPVHRASLVAGTQPGVAASDEGRAHLQHSLLSQRDHRLYALAQVEDQTLAFIKSTAS
uniref:Uncharacterized protein n=1 Tax=Lotharella globosa TaxID=91324 RepID=A0A7S3YZ80_9EUKA